MVSALLFRLFGTTAQRERLWNEVKFMLPRAPLSVADRMAAMRIAMRRAK